MITAAGAAGITAAVHVGNPIVTVVIIAIIGVALTVVDKDSLNLSVGYDQKTVETEEFSVHNNLGRIICGLAAPIAGLLIPAGTLDLPIWLTTGALSLLGGLGMWLATRKANPRVEREGKRRMRELIARSEVDGVRTEHLELAEKHRNVIAALVRCGAVNGIRVRVWLLARAFPENSVEEIVAAARELAAAGLVGITTIDSGPDPSKYLIELTPAAAATMAALQQGR